MSSLFAAFFIYGPSAMYGPPTYRDQHVAKNQPVTVRVIDIASELGRTAYDAYRVALPGNMMLTWDQLTTPTRNAWYQAAQAAVNRVQAEQMALTERAAIMR